MIRPERRANESKCIGFDIQCDPKASRGQDIKRFIRWSSAAFVLIVVYSVVGPFGIALPGLNLDQSWKEVVGSAADLHLVFGRDIVFTSGPLAAIYTRYYPAQDFWRLLPFYLIAIGGLARFSWLCAARGSRPLVLAALLVSLLFAIWQRDAILLALPLLVALAAVDERADWGSLLLGMAALAAAGLAKFSIVILTGPLLLLSDLDRVARCRPPVLSTIWVGFLFFFFWCLTGDGHAFTQFIYYGWQISAGYTEAMQLAGNDAARMIFVLFAAFLLVTTGATEGKAAFDAERRRSAGLIKILAVFLFLFVLWKEGFVRQPSHDLIAFAGLPIGYAIYAGFADSRRANALGIHRLLAATAVMMIILFLPVGLGGPPPPAISDGVDDSPNVPTKVLAELHRLIEFGLGPQTYLAEAARQQEQAWTKIRLAAPLPPIAGTVDIIPSLQSSLLARHVIYRPRPTIQEYTSYTHALIEADRTSWFGPNGPQNIIFGFTPVDFGWTPIDNRLPALSEGPLWPDLFRFYKPDEIEGPLLLLRRRSTPLPNLLGTGVRRREQLGHWAPLPESGMPVFVSISLSQTFAGHALSLLYKPGLVFIETESLDGHRSRFRLVPNIARDGFIISPQVVATASFQSLACGDLRSLDRIRAFRVITQTEPVASYRRDYRYVVRMLNIAPLSSSCRAERDPVALPSR